MAILEHRVKEDKADKIIRKIATGWNGKQIILIVVEEGYGLFWDSNRADFNVFNMSCQFIHGHIKVPALALEFKYTSTYGLHTQEDRKNLWAELQCLEKKQQGAWLIMGDFNAVLYIDDRINGTEVQDT